MIIAVWGSNGSGKTTIAAHLACQIGQKAQTLVIGGALTHSSIQHHFGYSDSSRSIKNVLISCDTLLKNIIRYDRLGNLYILDNASTDDCLQCIDISDQQATDMLTEIYKKFDVVVIDCSVNFDNVLTRAALFQSEHIVFVVKPILESLSFLLSHRDLFNRLRLMNKIKYVLNGDKSLMNYKAIENELGIEFHAILKYLNNVQNVALKGVPITVSKIKTKRDKQFIDQMRGISEVMLNANEANRNSSRSTLSN